MRLQDPTGTRVFGRRSAWAAQPKRPAIKGSPALQGTGQAEKVLGHRDKTNRGTPQKTGVAPVVEVADWLAGRQLFRNG